jgi:hypothetical protein
LLSAPGVPPTHTNTSTTNQTTKQPKFNNFIPPAAAPGGALPNIDVRCEMTTQSASVAARTYAGSVDGPASYSDDGDIYEICDHRYTCTTPYLVDDNYIEILYIVLIEIVVWMNMLQQVQFHNNNES